MTYFDDWSSYEDMIGSFGNLSGRIVPASDDVLFASYTYEDYLGDAFVLFRHDGKLYEVNGSHCSCHGLESQDFGGGGGTQWEPEETTVDALELRGECPVMQCNPETKDAWRLLLLKLKSATGAPQVNRGQT